MNKEILILGAAQAVLYQYFNYILCQYTTSQLSISREMIGDITSRGDVSLIEKAAEGMFNKEPTQVSQETMDVLLDLKTKMQISDEEWQETTGFISVIP
jgi:hypothetical protein